MDDKDKIIASLRKQLKDANSKIIALEQEVALLKNRKEESNQPISMGRIIKRKAKMNNKNKVTIEITAEGWETKVSLNGKEYSEVHKKSEHGADGVNGDFETEGEIPEELYNALNGFFEFDVMNALNEIEE